MRPRVGDPPPRTILPGNPDETARETDTAPGHGLPVPGYPDSLVPDHARPTP